MKNTLNENADGGGMERLVELLLRVKIHELRGDRGQAEMILLLDTLGFTSGEIIRFLGAPASTVRPLLSRAHKNK